ncbi:MAG: hypothetical protein ACFCD0_14230 [Gemmataceae bacterium]
MKHLWFSFLALSLFAVSSANGLAQETTEIQLKFAKGLRANRLSDLALDYLQKVQKGVKGDLALQKQLGLEIARTQVSLAAEKVPSQRLPLLEQAKKTLTQFQKQNQGTLAGAKLTLEIAKIEGYAAQALLGQSYRQEDKEDQTKYSQRAKIQFRRANDQFKAAVKELATLTSTSPKARGEWLRAKFEQAKSLTNTVAAYSDFDALDTTERRKRSTLLQDAEKLLKEIRKVDIARSELYFMTLAWSIEIAQELKDWPKANTLVGNFFSNYKDNPKAARGSRWASYFYIRGLALNEEVEDRLQATVKVGEAWLQAYPKYHTTPEGQGVRYELALAYLNIGETLKKDDEKKAQGYFTKAENLFFAIADSDSDLAAQANNYYVQLRRRTIQDLTLEDLNTFNDCFLKGNLEYLEFKKVQQEYLEANKSNQKEREQARDKQLGKVTQAFDRALMLATDFTSPRKIYNIYLWKAFIFLAANDPYRATIASEYLARLDPPVPQSSTGAEYALQAATMVYSENQNKINKQKITDLAKFIVEDRKAQWKHLQCYPVAHYQLAIFAMQDRDQDAALFHLEQLPPTYSGYLQAQCQMALMALGAQKGIRDKKKLAKYDKKAREAFQRVEAAYTNTEKNKIELPAGTLPLYFGTQVEYSRILYSDAIAVLKKDKKMASAEFKRMDDFLTRLISRFEKTRKTKDAAGDWKIPQESQKQIETTLYTLRKYSRLGQVQLASVAGEHIQVVNLTAPTIKRIEKLTKDKKSVELRDYDVTRQLLGYALRSHIQKGDLSAARKSFALLQKIRDASSFLDMKSQRNKVLEGLIFDLNRQLRTLREEDKAEQLQATISNYTEFFDGFAKNESLNYNQTLFLANAYASLEKHQKAAELYAKVPMPEAPEIPEGADAKTLEKSKEAHEKEVLVWWLMQSMYAEQLRKAGKLDEAYKVAMKVLTTKEANGKLQARQQLNHIYEARGLWAKAANGWGKFMRDPQLKKLAPINEKAKELYFQAYFHYYKCLYKYSQGAKVKGTKAEEKYLRIGVQNLVDLERANGIGWKTVQANVEQLRQDEPAFDKMYQTLKKKSEK